MKLDQGPCPCRRIGAPCAECLPQGIAVQPVGEHGQERDLTLELKLIADVGIVGFPNSGKSTLLSVVSAAKPKIADYPFTTLTPNLGIVSYRDDQSFIMADIPGIIEGASEGKGLGLRFLRHIERNSLLLFMVPADSDDINKEFEILLNELRQYNPELMDKKRILAITKSDLLDDELIREIKQTLPPVPYVFISSIARTGLMELKDLFTGRGDRSSQLDDLLSQNLQRRTLLEQFRVIIEEMESLQDRLEYFSFDSLAGRERIEELEIEPDDGLYFLVCDDCEPPSRKITNPNTNCPTWNATAIAPWLSIGPCEGYTPSSVTVSINKDGLPEHYGLYTAPITITSTMTEHVNNPKTITATINYSSHCWRNYLPLLFKGL